MKPDIHPKQNTVTVIFPDGSKVEIQSCMKQNELHAEMHYSRHPAWNPTKVGMEADAQNKDIAKFNERFGGVDFGNLFGGSSENQ
mgnify:FL=1